MVACTLKFDDNDSNWRASCKKGIYRILADFHFLGDRANFWQTDLFWHGKHCSVIVSADLRFRSPEITCAKKTQLSSGDLLFNEKQKKPFVSLSFISHIITVISYCCFVSESDWGIERAWCEFVLSWHRFETRSADFFFFFFICFSTYFKNQNIYLKKTCSQSCLK